MANRHHSALKAARAVNTCAAWYRHRETPPARARYLIVSPSFAAKAHGGCIYRAAHAD